ncbi:lipoprotein [Streptomyces hygroscopicus]|uniref:CAP domain-containing protein n=1 Tax=Streptomyces hygroscopicus TaxID=1912 RepID=UPI0022405B60|nr:CAP domain-containing protein [Streptomyces hygroscopicus]MCW7945658.1 lipoprotein [Streptomyces hygroscopicus]
MGIHRKRNHYRRIVIAAVTVGAVGVPSVALACTDWRDSAGHHYRSAGKHAANGWWNDAWDRNWNGGHADGPSPAASKTPSPSTSTPKTTAPKPPATAPSSTAKATAPRPTTAAPAAPAAPSAPKPTATASGFAARIVQLVNAERSKVGCPAVTLNAILTKAAQAHSDDMAAHQNMSHTGSDGSSPGDRITRAGYNWSSYGENIAYGYATPEQVMAGWMSSPGHKANILDCGFKEIGVGLAQPNSYWTQDFATAG